MLARFLGLPRPLLSFGVGFAHVRTRCSVLSVPRGGSAATPVAARNHFSACCRPERAGPPRGGASTGQQRNDSRPAPHRMAPPAAAGGGHLSADSRRFAEPAARAGGRRDGVAAVGDEDQRQQTAAEVGSEAEEPLYAVNGVQAPDAGAPLSSTVFMTLKSPSGQSLQFLVDSGSECNVVSLSDYERVTDDVTHRYLQTAVSALRMHDDTLVSTLGKANLRFMNPSSGRRVILKCRIVKHSVMPIISLLSSVELGLINVLDVDPLDYVPHVSADAGPAESLTRAGVMAEFERVFDTSTPGRVVNDYNIVTDP